jgi:ribonuclease BN (tRNA processing enzyme)
MDRYSVIIILVITLYSHNESLTMKPLFQLLLILGISLNAVASPTQCENKQFTLQLLGSGGPISDDARASSGSVVWIDGKSRLLIDAGGGTYLRFGEAGAKLEDLQFIGISHFHTDHSADLPALLKGGYFLDHDESIVLAGPSERAPFPSMTGFTDAMFYSSRGAFAYLAGLKDASDGIRIALHPLDVDVEKPVATQVFERDNTRVSALGIPHGSVPALAFRIEGPKGVIVISADQNGSRPEFIKFAEGADILVMPAAIDEDSDKKSRYLHAVPSVIGQIAAEVNPKLLVLNHFMGKSLHDKDENIKIISSFYHGKIYAGRDLSCFPVATK